MAELKRKPDGTLRFPKTLKEVVDEAGKCRMGVEEGNMMVCDGCESRLKPCQDYNQPLDPEGHPNCQKLRNTYLLTGRIANPQFRITTK